MGVYMKLLALIESLLNPDLMEDVPDKYSNREVRFCTEHDGRLREVLSVYRDGNKIIVDLD